MTYTSGTTGPPKGAMNTRGNMRYGAEVLSNWYGLERSDVIWAIMPFFDISGVTTAFASRYVTCRWSVGAPPTSAVPTDGHSS